MATVVERPQPGAATHALIIGAGDYPHVGAAATHPLPRGLRSLSSPPVSALSLARFLDTHYANEAAPLGSIELLVSGATDTGGWAPSEPTRAGIEAAFARWWQRGDRHPDNVLLFFFCGHGYQRSQFVVLPSDFGASALNPLAGAIDVTQTRLGTARCRARTQLWLVDACREAPSELLATVGAIGTPLAQPTATGQVGLDSTMLASATDYRRASGLPGEPSRFTRALLAALAGGAAETDADGIWRIRTGRLQYAINAALLEETQRRGWPEQQCESLSGTGNAVLMTLSDPPSVPVLVCCEPNENLARVALYVRGDNAERARPPHPAPWETNVPAGIYRVGASPEPPGEMPEPRESLTFLAPPSARAVVRW